ncbi:MAG: hypothetical protein ACM3OH_03170 [Bacillota bacterium]
MITPTQHLILALCCIGAAACGDRSAGKAQAGTARAGTAATCPDASFISTTIGFTVRSMRDASRSAPGTLLCAYQATDSRLGAFVSIAVAPLAAGEDAMSEIRAAARTILGAQADAQPIDVGERGYAYGSASKSEAAAIRMSQVYHVDVTAAGIPRLGDKKDAVIAILRKVVGT